MAEVLTFYAYAPKGKKIGQLLVTRINGRRSSQEWTGKTYNTAREAVADMERLNCIEREKPIVDNSHLCGCFPCDGGKDCWENTQPIRSQCAGCLCAFCTFGTCAGGELIRKERSGS